MFKKLFLWIVNKFSRNRRKLLFNKLSFINVAKKEYEKMKKEDNFKADTGYLNLAKMMKENVYPRLFEAMEKHGRDHVKIKTRDIKEFKIDIDGLVSMKEDEGEDMWEQLGNSISDDWEPLICLCHSKVNILSYPKVCESIMNKLDELTENDMRNKALLERAKKFKTVYIKKVLVEKHIL